MSSFTYTEPDPDDFLTALRALLKSKHEEELLGILRGATCTISGSSQYSRRRWDAMWTEVLFHVPPERLAEVSETTEDSLRGYCDLIMPRESGLDVMKVSLVPRLGAPRARQQLEEEIAQLSETLESATLDVRLPSDLLSKGREMAQVYSFLYCAENILRLFIGHIVSDKYGTNDLSQLTIPKSIRDGIAFRKRNEERNKWLSIRGNSDLFYTDFKDLADIITNNWPLFAAYFPDQAWIRTKIEEMANCRNLIAHNSYIDDHERDVIRLNFRSILRQIGAYVHDDQG
jgi:hypothetical protein